MNDTTIKHFFSINKRASKAQVFRHACEINLAKKFGAKFRNFTPDSCDMIFPSKDALEMFENARGDL